MRFRAARLGAALPGYGATLGDEDPGPLLSFPSSGEAPDGRLGAALIDGVFPFAGQTVSRSEAYWTGENVSPEWLAEMHSFSWLTDLTAMQGTGSEQRAVSLIMDWIDQNRELSSPAWNAPVLGTRICAWLFNYGTVFGGLDDMVQRRIRRSLARQSAHLDRVAGHEGNGSDRLVALIGLAFSSLCLRPMRRRMTSIMKMLCAELDRQILPDGGHIERNPAILAMLLRKLVDLRTAVHGAQQEVPSGLQNAIDRMTPMVRFFCHGDGGLALFNGANENAPDRTASLLKSTGCLGKAVASARHSGYERLQAGTTLVLVDAGDPPPPGLDRFGHAGALSFEMSSGKERLIVNCGSARDQGDEWRDAQRSTPAHSTLSLSLTNSSAVTENGFGPRRAHVTAERSDEAGAQWLDMKHDGFADPLGFVHRRRLFLDSSGDDFRGEDCIIPVDATQPVSPRRFEIRFHLHPAVQSSLLANQSAALLRLPGGGGWRFRSSGAAIRLEDSIYLGRSGEPRRARQLVLTGETGDGERVVKWAVRREGA